MTNSVAEIAARPLLLRVQDGEGRGPYRPGLSKFWSSQDGPICPPWWVELGMEIRHAHSLMEPGYHWGCGFRTRKQFDSWFTRDEIDKLGALGFALVTIPADIILFDTPRQTVFGSKAPLTCVVGSRPLSEPLAVRAALTEDR